MKNGAKTMRQIAERRVEQYLRDHWAQELPVTPKDIVDLVIDTLEKPDKFMLNAGRAELRLAVPQQVRTCDVTALAGATWRAMLARAH